MDKGDSDGTMDSWSQQSLRQESRPQISQLINFLLASSNLEGLPHRTQSRARFVTYSERDVKQGNGKSL